MTERLLVRHINIYGSLEIYPIGLAFKTKIPIIVLIRLSELYDVQLEII